MKTPRLTGITLDGFQQGGKVLGFDETKFMTQVQKECEGTWEAIPNWHFAGLRADQMCPPTYPNNVSSEIIRGATRGRKSELDYPEVHLRREQKSNGVSVSLVWATSFCYNLSNQDFEERAP